MTVFAEDLDRAVCAVPDCRDEHQDLYFHGRCHPSAPTWAIYARGSGVLRLTCSRCSRLVTEIAVAKEAGR